MEIRPVSSKVHVPNNVAWDVSCKILKVLIIMNLNRLYHVWNIMEPIRNVDIR